MRSNLRNLFARLSSIYYIYPNGKKKGNYLSKGKKERKGFYELSIDIVDHGSVI